MTRIDVPHMELEAPPTDRQALAGVLCDLAETASETIELQEVFGRVAAIVRRVIPFDHMGVVRILDEEWAVKHATTLDSTPHPSPGPKACPLSAWSPRLRPRCGPIPRVDDATIELDPSFSGDADILGAGVRSTLWEPFRIGQTFGGGVWLCAHHPHAFTDEHQELLRPIAALLGSAVEHWRIWDTERRRRQRLDQLEALLGTFAESLDVREVFPRISEGVKPILPHDLMVLTELDVPGSALQLIARAGECDLAQPPTRLALTKDELARRYFDFDLLRDIPAELEPTTERNRVMVATGMRSWLRVPVWLGGVAHGSLGFFHREAARYDKGDVEVASRLADRVALMLSHQKLAEEARDAAEARERAERLEATVETLAREVASRGRGRIVGVSPEWKDAMVSVGRVASSETTVLITGESGTGKEVISSLIHQGSARAGKPFVAINCAALPEQLLESELFGHEKGAFTGAIASKIGRIEQAAGGTLFLDEIAEMSPLVQAKFLRVLEEREFQRLGGTRTLKADVRIIAATNRDLQAGIARQTFREDLFYRLNVFQIHIPPLRERTQDIQPLAEAFLEDLGKTMGRPAAGISRAARERMLAYAWPGNVRELRNAIERAILLCDGGLITHDHLPALTAQATPVFGMPLHSQAVNGASSAANGSANGNGHLPPEGVNLEVMERSLVERALEQAHRNKSKAARLLGLSRAQLYWRLEKYGIQ